jgi:RES domain
VDAGWVHAQSQLLAEWGNPPGRATSWRGGPGSSYGGDVQRVNPRKHLAPTSGRRPKQLGEPPGWLDERKLPIIEPPVSEFFHAHSKSRGPLNFNPTPNGRFNAPNGEYGTTYLSTTLEGAFVEKFLQDAPRGKYGHASVHRERLDSCCLCSIPYGELVAPRPLRLVDLSGNGTFLIGATGELCALADIARLSLVQRWALRLYRHHDCPDGILYRARHDQSRLSIALFDRANGVLTAHCSTNILEDDVQLAAILSYYKVGLLDPAHSFKSMGR